MLELYFDDSGSHSGSPVVVWGGVLGHARYVGEMAEKWQAQLDAPCDGKPPIRKFHSFDLFHGTGEFVGYNQGARDLTRRNFRKIIVDAGLTIVAQGISRRDWDEVVTGSAKVMLKEPESIVFGMLIKKLCGEITKQKMPAAFVFDQGCASRFDMRQMFDIAANVAKIDPNLISYGVSSVEGNCALQAADMVAHETYQFFCDFAHSEDAQLGPHLKRLYGEAYDSHGSWMPRDNLKTAADHINALIEATKDDEG